MLKGIDLEIESGEFTVLVGPSGCGKSTLLNIIAGLERPSAGTVEIGGRVVNDVPPKDRDIAMVFQSYALYPTMTVRQNITFGMECRNVPKRRAGRGGGAGCAPAADRRRCSTASRRSSRAASASASPWAARWCAIPCCFCSTSRSPISTPSCASRCAWRSSNCTSASAPTIVYVTHDQIEAMTMATRIAVMHQGEVQQFADPETVYNRPANLFVARFMGSPPMNTLSARLEATADGTVAAIGQGEAAIRFPVPAGTEGWIGRDVVLGIRPECIAEPTRHFSDAPDAALTIAAPVEMIEPTGAETIVVLRIGDDRALGRVSPDLRHRLGETARFAVDTRKISLFDPATGDRIA